MEKILQIQRQKGLQMAAMKMNTRVVSLTMMKIQRSCHHPLFIAAKVTFKKMMMMHNTAKRQIKTKDFLKKKYGILTNMNSELRSIQWLPSLLMSISFLVYACYACECSMRLYAEYFWHAI
jgi:hypothetical protein